MLKNIKEPKEIREAMLSLLPTSGTLAGIAIGLTGLINIKAGGSAATLADDILLLSSLGFLLVCYLIFFAMRSENSVLQLKIMHAIDVVFLISLTLVVFSGFLVVYEII